MDRPLIVSFKYLLALSFMLIFLFPNQAWCKRTIYGHITMPDGTPAKGVGVIAWDSDGFGGGKDDFMQKTHTDSSGNYRMTYYKKGPWDTKGPDSESFRPDIYLTIHTLEVGTLPVKKTGVKSNWRMSKDLKLDVIIPGIKGKITGAPAEGVLIKAFDSDGLLAGKDDLIAQTRTMADGRYMMLYGGKHYDSTPPSPGTVAGYLAGSLTGFPGIDALTAYVVNYGWNDQMHRRWTKWRPDIYIKVYTNPVRKSRVYKDWPHRDILTINMNLSPKPGSSINPHLPTKPGMKAK
jgi:hypothetical protein